MSFPQNLEENRTTSTEETEQPLPENSEQAQSNITVLQPQLTQQDNRQYHTHQHQHIDQQSVEVDQRQYHAHHHHHQVVHIDNWQNITKIALQHEQSSVPSGDQEDSNKAFRKLKDATRRLYDAKFDVDVTKFDIPSSNCPEVYPELLSVDFYEGRFIPNDDQYDPKNRQIEFKEFDKKVTIDQLLHQYQSQNFISIVGYPGAGKTTLSKRMARCLDQKEDLLVLRILFMSMNDCDDETLTLKEFLLGDVNFNLEEEEINALFDWMRKHPQNVFLIFDGFDQVNWNVLKKITKVNYNTSLTYQKLVSNLCHGYFLRNCHIVFTSRPHAMLEIPQTCRPKKTYFVRDLTTENMKRLFDALINDNQKASRLWNELTVKTPHLESMCHNPLMLQLYLRASLGSSHETNDISTMTGIFHRVLENLKASGHTISLTDEIVVKLSKIAFRATKNKTVLITIKDLVNENLVSQEVQDTVVTLFGSNRTCGLLEGNRRLYFSHQTFQEFFSALYMVEQMSVENFASFIQTNLLVDHWSVVVQFLSGLLLDPSISKDLPNYAPNQHPSDESMSTLTRSSSLPTTSSSQIASSSLSSTTIQLPSEEFDALPFQPPIKQARLSSPPQPHSQQAILFSPSEKLQKQKVFISELYEKTREVAANHNDSRSIIAVTKILREGKDEEVIVTAGSHFDGGWIRMDESDTQNDFHAVTSFLKSMPARVRYLRLSECRMISNQFRPWKNAIKSMPGSIVLMNFPGNFLEIDDIIEILHKVEEEVGMWDSLNDGDGRWRSPNMEERSKLQEALNRLDNKKLRIAVRIDYVTHKDRDD